MLREFIAAGFSEELFWALSPRQVAAHFAAARVKAVREHNSRMEQAYLTAVIPMMKKPPKLASLMIPEGAASRRQQSPEEAKAVMRKIFASRRAKGAS